MASSSSSTPAPLVSFARGTIITLTLWPALRIAVEGGWGGPESPQKRTWLASAIVDAFEDAFHKNEPVPDAIYVEEMLLQVMSDEFGVLVDDGTSQPVAAGIVQLWQEIMHEGKAEGVSRLEDLLEKSKGKKMVVDEKDASDEEYQWEDDDEDDDEEGDGGESESENTPEVLDRPRDKPRDEPEVDEDGFTMVKGRGKGHR